MSGPVMSLEEDAGVRMIANTSLSTFTTPVTMLGSGEFFGTNVKAANQPGLTMMETQYEPYQHVPSHGHEPAYFCFLLAGGYWEQYGRRRVTYDPGSLAFHPAGEVHHGDIGAEGGRCFNVAFAPYWLERVEAAGRLPPEIVDCHTGDLPWLARRLHREFASPDATTSIITEGIALEMLGTLMRQERARRESTPRWLRVAEQRLREEFDRPLTVAGVAKDLQVSPVRLARAFRRQFGESVGERLRRIRVGYASERLRMPDVPIVAIAGEAGFSDQSHLTRVFKKLTGVTPGEFRRIHQAGRVPSS